MANSLDSARNLAAALDEPTEVLPWLLIGSFGAAEHGERLRAAGVTHLVSLIGVVPDSANAFETLVLDVSDEGRSDLGRLLPDFMSFVEPVRSAGGRVLVFCNLGVNRSAAVVAGYLQSALGWSCEAALAHLKRSRPAVSIHEEYLSQLRSAGS
jgi:hypothetical protein